MQMELRQWLLRCLEEHRGLVILLFCLPASFIFDMVMRVQAWFRSSSSPTEHTKRAGAVQAAVRAWNKLPKENRRSMCTAKPNWLSLSTTFFRKDEHHRIPIDLSEILHLDEHQLTVTCEPNATVRQLTHYLVPKGYTLAVCLEIGDATAGGLAFGVGMTTHSHKVGLYQETVVSYELVLADGRLVEATMDNEFGDLFRCLPWSHGTLAFCTALTLRVIRVKPYVHLKYIPVHNQDEYCREMMRLSGAEDKSIEVPDYLEATIFSREEAVIMVGNMVDLPRGKKVNRVTQWYKPWFYKHTQSFLYKKNGGEEYIPVQEYLLRHNRAIFWVLESMIPFGNHPLFRLFFGWLCPPKPAFLKFTTTRAIREMTFTKQVFQDIVMPLSTLKEQVNTATQLFDTFPLLVYACRIYHHGDEHQGQIRAPPRRLMCPDTNYAMYNDLGVYGTPGLVKKRLPYNATEAMRAMEKFTRDVGGYSFLYADIFMTREEFEQMFDLTLYNRVRAKYGCNGAFPDLYDKVRPEIDVIALGQEYGDKKKR